MSENSQISRLIFIARSEICATCPTPCDKQASEDFRRIACSQCPLIPRLWGPVGLCKDGEPSPTFGLGDLVARVANPIAKMSDAAFGTKLVGCGGCAQRREALNKLLPSIGKPPSPDGQ